VVLRALRLEFHREDRRDVLGASRELLDLLQREDLVTPTVDRGVVGAARDAEATRDGGGVKLDRLDALRARRDEGVVLGEVVVETGARHDLDDRGELERDRRVRAATVEGDPLKDSRTQRAGVDAS